MSVIEQGKGAQALEKRLARTESPRHRHMLEVAIAHLRADEVGGYYSQLVADRRGILEYDIDTIVLDDETLVTSGPIRAINRGSVAARRGWAVDDLDADYVVTMRATILWPFSDAGELLGEDSGGGLDPNDFVRLDPDEL